MKLKTNLVGIFFFLCLTALANDDAPKAYEEPAIEQPKGVTLVDSASLDCDGKILTKKICEFYLVYDGRDDIVYLVKRGHRKEDKVFSRGGLNREFVQKEAFFSLDLVKEFSTKASPVDNYSVGFKKVDGQLKIRVTLLFEEDNDQVEKLVDVNLYKDEN